MNNEMNNETVKYWPCNINLKNGNTSTSHHISSTSRAASASISASLAQHAIIRANEAAAEEEVSSDSGERYIKLIQEEGEYK